MGSHKLHKLTSLFVKKTTAPGKYGDGHGLYLIVDASGAKRWEQRLVIQGRRRDIGLGSAALVSLEEAREQALKNKKMQDNSPVQPTLLRLKHIIGDGSNAPIIPISKSAWWEGVKQGKYPQPIKIGSNTTVWRSDDIQQLVNQICDGKIV